MKNSVITVLGFLLISLGCAIFFVSQVSRMEEKHPIFSTTVTVPFSEQAKLEYFYTSALLDELTSYAIVFGHSDLHIEAVNLTAPNGDTVIAGQDCSFKTIAKGTYTFLVTGHYLLMPDIGNPPPGPWDSSGNSKGKSGGALEWEHNIWHASELAKENIDDSVDVSIFELEGKPEYVHPYGVLWPGALVLWGIGVIVPITATVMKRKNV